MVSSCTLNKVDEVHGVSNLQGKSKSIKINISNKNDVSKILGPSLIMNNEIGKWSYFEVRKTKSKLGKSKIYLSNYIEIFFDKYGIVKNIDFYDLRNQNKIKFAEDITTTSGVKDSFTQNLLSSMRKRLEMNKEKIKSSK